MTTSKLLAALLGFAFVAAWIGFGLGYAVLCLVGAAACYAGASYLEGDLDLGELQGRMAAGGGLRQPAAPVAASPRPRARPRVR